MSITTGLMSITLRIKLAWSSIPTATKLTYLAYFALFAASVAAGRGGKGDPIGPWPRLM